MRTWHMVAAWLDFDPATSSDPDEGEPREENFCVEADDLDGAIARGRELYPHAAVIDLEWVEWEPWPGLVLEISDYPRWETIHESPWTGHGYLLLRDCAPVPAGLERESLKISAEQIRRLIDGQGKADCRDGQRHPGWLVQDGWLVHDDADRLGLAAKSLADEPARCLAHPRIREIVAGPHEYAPILGLDEHGEVVVVTIGRKA
jgi:hypothetical protein